MGEREWRSSNLIENKKKYLRNVRKEEETKSLKIEIMTGSVTSTAGQEYFELLSTALDRNAGIKEVTF